MTHSESRQSATGERRRRPTGGKRSATPTPSRRKTEPSRRARAIQQARVLAMQMLFEDDLTDHELDDIVQHLGEQQRGELTDAYIEVRTRANSIIEIVDFLARNTGSEPGMSSVAQFSAASHAALATLSEPDEAEEGERSDYVPPVQLRAEEITRPILSRYRDSVEHRLETGTATPDARTVDDARFAAKWASLYGEEARESEEHDEDAQHDPLIVLRIEAAHDVSTTLANHERASRATMMEMVQRTSDLVHGVIANRIEIDAAIERAAPAFPIEQIASVDRSVLRLAVYELYHEPGTPPRVAVNEAVEIAKRYGGENSGRFVNGVLRTIANTLPPASSTISTE